MTAARKDFRRIGKPSSDPVVRFWQKVDKGDGCWVWLGGRNHLGYGAAWWGGRVVMAHRVAWEIANGTKPGVMDVCHKCDNPSCVRPDHLFLGTASDNLRDMVAKGRGRMQYEKGQTPFSARLTPDAVRTIRFLAKCDAPVSDIASMYSISKTTVRAVLLGLTYGSVR